MRGTGHSGLTVTFLLPSGSSDPRADVPAWATCTECEWSDGGARGEEGAPLVVRAGLGSGFTKAVTGEGPLSPGLPGVRPPSWFSSYLQACPSHLLLCPTSNVTAAQGPLPYFFSLYILSLGNGIHFLHLKILSMWMTPPAACPAHISLLNFRPEFLLACRSSPLRCSYSPQK